MLKTNSNIPLSEIKVGNMFSVPSNSDQSESSTGDSNPIGEFSKCKEEILTPKNRKKQTKGKKKNKKEIIKNEKLLNKKTKRTNSKYIKKDNIINIIFNEFKSSSLYKKFPQFHTIEKNIKNELYSSPQDLAGGVRNTFSNIFSSFSHNLDSSKYSQVLILSEIFEKIYKKYDCNSIAKKAQNLFDIINKLKKELHKYEIGNNVKTGNNEKKKSKENKNEISIKIYKENILNKINKLNLEQKKGIIGIISQNLIDKNEENNVVEFNINKIPFNQLKQLDKYINECINYNSILISKMVKNCGILGNNFIEERKENDVLENDDDFSSIFSDDEYDNDDLE